MRKVFVLGAPGSGTLKISEELYARDDFRKIFTVDPIYRRTIFPPDIKWAAVKDVIDGNYDSTQTEPYEVHCGWWLYKYYQKIVETYPDAIIILLSRNSQESLCTIGISGSSHEAIEKNGGEVVYRQKIMSADVEIHRIAESLDATWKYINSDETIFDNEFKCINLKYEHKPATIKIAVGNV